MISPSQAELMAPVGSYEALQAAIQAGAHSIYFGVTQLNMRARAAANFTLNDLDEIMKRCHQAGLKAYLVVNTLLYDHDITIMKLLVDRALEAGVDAIIAFDFATIQYCNQINIPVHVSVQFSVSNYESLKFFAQFTNRVVLARELTLDQIKDIYIKIQENQLMGREWHLMEIEAFAHGALCVAQSGRCFMSLYTHNASANRGACLQNCRARYKVTDVDTGNELIVDNHYIMSAADICTIDFLDQLLEAGVQVLKFEGRGRAPEYVYKVIKAYKNALHDIETWNYTPERIEGYYKELESVYNRTLSRGNYYLGKELWAYSNVHGSKATEERTHIGFVEHYYPKVKVAQIKMQNNTIKKWETLLITGKTTGVMYITPDSFRVNKEEKESATKGDILTFIVPDRVRENDKVYVIRERTQLQQSGNGTGKKNKKKKDGSDCCGEKSTTQEWCECKEERGGGCS